MNDEILKFELPKNQSSIIKVIGVGGGGCNAVKHMYEQGIHGVDFVVCNTDAQSLEVNPVPNKIQIGKKGLGAGSVPIVGRESAIEDIEKIRNNLQTNTEMIFITAGLGGGTGTGAAPVIAQLAREMGILTVGIVTLPFGFEGRKRKSYADEGIIELKNNVDALLIICNDRLRELYGNLKMTEAFSKADNILTTAAKSIAEIITCVGGINVDLEDVKTVMRNSGVAIMGNGTAEGENRSIRAVEQALTSPLLNDNNIKGAKDILLYLTYGNDELSMDEVSEITDYIREEAEEDVNLIWGHGKDDSLNNEISVTLIATGFNASEIEQYEPSLLKKTIVSVIPEKNNNIQETKTNEVNIFKLGEVKKVVTNQNNNVSQNVYNAKSEIIIKEIKTEPIKIYENKKNEFEKINLQEKINKETKLDTGENQIYTINDNSNKIELEVKTETKTADKKIDNNQKFTDLLEESRLTRLRNMSTLIKTPHGLQEIESIPAYKRKEIQLIDPPLSNEQQSSEFTIDNNDKNFIEIKRRNPYLHDNVD